MDLNCFYDRVANLNLSMLREIAFKLELANQHLNFNSTPTNIALDIIEVAQSKGITQDQFLSVLNKVTGSDLPKPAPSDSKKPGNSPSSTQSIYIGTVTKMNIDQSDRSTKIDNSKLENVQLGHGSTQSNASKSIKIDGDNNNASLESPSHVDIDKELEKLRTELTEKLEGPALKEALDLLKGVKTSHKDNPTVTQVIWDKLKAHCEVHKFLSPVIVTLTTAIATLAKMQDS